MNYKHSVTLLVFCFFFITSMNSQWKIISERFPKHVKVYSLAKNNNTIFAGTNEGVYKSVDGGYKWQCIDKKGFQSLLPKPFGQLRLTCISVREKMLLAGTNGIGVFMYDGAKWKLSADGFPDGVTLGLPVG